MSEKARASRTRTILVVLILFGLLFTGRLFFIQVVNGEHYKTLARSEQLRKFEIPANRGSIFIRDGDNSYPLVLNENYKVVYADPRYVEDVDDTAEQLADVLEGEEEKYRALISDKEQVYVVVEKSIDPQKAEAVEELKLSGIGLQDSPKRAYPEGSLASQIIGFVNDEGVGQYGIEGYLDEDLSGESGLLKAITDARGIPISTSDSDSIKEPAVDGNSVVLTIDRNVQRATEEAVKTHVERTGGVQGSAIVLDPETGAIIAMANYPSLEPQKFGEVEDQELFLNAVVVDAYEPGSVIKPFTMSAGLQTGAVTPSSQYYDSGSVEVDDRTIMNASEKIWGQQDMTGVIVKSINTGIVHVLAQMGGGTINDQARNNLYDFLTNNYRFGSSLGIAQTSENAGVVIAPSEVQGNNVRYSNMAFGQGMTATMLQVASAFSTLVNGGDYYQPHLIYSTIDSESGEEIVNEPQIISNNAIGDDVSLEMRKMLVEVIQSGGGYYARRAGYTIGGKTGTSQLLDSNGEYSISRYTGSFVGFISSDKQNLKPDYVVMTRIVEPKVGVAAGAEAAVPVFRDIIDFMINHYQIPPTD